MKRIAIAAAGLMALALSATVSSAAPLSGLGSQAAGVEASIVKVHGVHRSCRLGRWGWHRSTWGGRVWCRPQGEYYGNWRRHGRRHNDWNDNHRGNDGGNYRQHNRRRWN